MNIVYVWWWNGVLHDKHGPIYSHAACRLLTVVWIYRNHLALPKEHTNSSLVDSGLVGIVSWLLYSDVYIWWVIEHSSAHISLCDVFF